MQTAPTMRMNGRRAATVGPRHFERVKNQQQYRRLSEKIAQHFRDIFWTTPSRHYSAFCLECSIVTRVVL